MHLRAFGWPNSLNWFTTGRSLFIRFVCATRTATILAALSAWFSTQLSSTVTMISSCTSLCPSSGSFRLLTLSTGMMGRLHACLLSCCRRPFWTFPTDVIQCCGRCSSIFLSEALVRSSSAPDRITYLAGLLPKNQTISSILMAFSS